MGDGTCDFTMTCLSNGTPPTSRSLQRLFCLRTKVTKVEDIGLDPGYYEDGTSSYHVQVTPERASSSLFDDLAKRLRDPDQMRLECNKSNPGWWVSWPKPVDITRNEHYDLQLSHFALGSFVGLGTFVEHYRSSARELATEPAKNKNNNKPKLPSSTAKQRYRITQCMAHFAHYRRSIYLYFVDVKEPPVKQEQNGETHARHRFVIDYTSVRRIVLSSSPGGTLVAYLHLLHPPLLYRVHKVHRPEKEDSDDEMDPRKPVYVAQHEICPDSKWVRSVDFGKSVTKCSNATLGACRVLAMAFPAAGADEHLKALSSLGALCASTSLFYGAVDCVPRVELAPGGAGIGEAEKELQIQDALPYGCRFALAAVWSTSAQVADELLLGKSKKEVASTLQSMASEDPTALEEALYALQQSLDRGRLASLQVGLKSLYDRYHTVRKQREGAKALTGGVLCQDLPSHVVLVRRAVLTPTRLVPLPPEPISTSRILRHFEPDHALRVVLRDEDGSRMSFSLGVQRRHFLFSVTLPRLLDGFLIAGRRFEFLSTSSSQLRSHGAWFYSVDSHGRSAADVRDALGDLSHLRVPSKYMARLGLAFSQSLGSVHVPRKCTSVEPDIECPGPRKNLHYVFSDGVGRISPALLARVHEALPQEGRPSAIQIRYGGCKGMLVLDPTLADAGESIVFRRSQYKHPSDSEDLFVLKTSKPRVVKLNRPMITILGQKRTSSQQRSIPDTVFLELQRQCLAPYADSLCDDAAAARLLHAECALELPYRELAAAGLDLHAEPFFRSLLWTLHQRCLQQLREKANISIPPDQGRTMFGVMDETGTLAYGQVFIQYAQDMMHYGPDDKYVVLQGPVIVTKNPCHHMGDIRKLEAVDVPALHHIRDCIVFPSIGKRPHPNEMAGSDLDGDEYSVIWHPALIFHKNDDPMHFYDSEAQEKEGPVEVEDMVDFVCQYIERDVVGLISNAHLAWADWLRDGVRSNMCVRLAEKVARAVDFAKLGRPESLRASEKPAAYPDFMAKHSEHYTYLSQRVLGKLYRELSGMVLDSVGTVAVVDVRPDIRLLIDGRERHAEAARRALERYRLRIRSLLTTYGIASELEALSGAVMAMDARISEKRDHSDTAVVVDSQVKHIMACTYDDFLDGLDGDYHEALCRASAWYSCAYEHGAQAEGFTWSIATHLLAILRDAAPVTGLVRGSMRDRLTQALVPREDQLEVPFERALFNNTFKLLRLWAKGNQGCLWGKDSDAAASYLKMAKSALEYTIQQLNRQLGMERIRRKPGLVLVNCFRNLVQGRQKGGKFECALADLAERTLHRMLYPGGAWFDNGKLPLEESVTPVGPTQTQVVLLPLPEGENDFFLEVVRQEDRFTSILKHWTQLDRLRFTTWKDRRGDWFFQLMATGSPWALDRLKQTVVHQNFRDEFLRILTNQPVV